MKNLFLLLLMAAFTAASAQTAPKKTIPSSSTKTSTSGATTAPPWIRLPAGVPRVAHGPVKTAVALRYEDIKVGTGPVGESGKLWHIQYTGWRAADGVQFDSWNDHKEPIRGADGKFELGPDGKPKLGDPQPLVFPQGMARLIPGFDYGVAGMRVGGKRRIFVPWQLAYGTRDIPDHPGHPGIPAKSDLIFDVELVDVTDMPAPQQRPMMPFHPAPGVPPHSGMPSTAPETAPKPAAPSAPSAPSTPPATAQPATPPPIPTPAPQPNQ